MHDHCLMKLAANSMLEALRKQVNRCYQQTYVFLPPDNPEEGWMPQRSPGKRIVFESREQVSPVLRDTIEVFNRFKKSKEIKKGMSEQNKSVLFECVFKVAAVFREPRDFQFLSLQKLEAKIEAAEGISEWFKAMLAGLPEKKAKKAV